MAFPCPVCKETTALRVTSCKSRHCVCTDCLEYLTRQRGPHFPCPVCRQPLTVPRCGVSAFPFQFTQKPGSTNLKHMLAVQQQASDHHGDPDTTSRAQWYQGEEDAESLAHLPRNVSLYRNGHENDSLPYGSESQHTQPSSGDWNPEQLEECEGDQLWPNESGPHFKNHGAESSSPFSWGSTVYCLQIDPPSYPLLFPAGVREERSFELEQGALGQEDKAACPYTNHSHGTQSTHAGVASRPQRTGTHQNLRHEQLMTDGGPVSGVLHGDSHSSNDGNRRTTQQMRNKKSERPFRPNPRVDRQLETNSELVAGIDDSKLAGPQTAELVAALNPPKDHHARSREQTRKDMDRDRQLAAKLQEESDRESARRLQEEINGREPGRIQRTQPLEHPQSALLRCLGGPFQRNRQENRSFREPRNQPENRSFSFQRNQPETRSCIFQRSQPVTQAFSFPSNYPENGSYSFQRNQPEYRSVCVQRNQPERQAFPQSRQTVQTREDREYARWLQENEIRGASCTEQRRLERQLRRILLEDPDQEARNLQEEGRRLAEQIMNDRMLAQRLQDEERQRRR